MLKLLVNILAVTSSATAQQTITVWGAYSYTDIQLPCLTPLHINLTDRESITWETEGKEIGVYTEETGFVPSEPVFEGKYDVTSIHGRLLVRSPVKGIDDKNYWCTIESKNTTNSTLEDFTDVVHLDIGSGITNTYMLTNGSTDGTSCYSHTGFSPLSCHATSDPPVEFVWNGRGEIGCQDPVNQIDNCIQDKSGLYHCSSTITPKDDCCRKYYCVMKYRLGLNLRERDRECVRIKELDDEDDDDEGVWYWLNIFAVVVLVLIVVAAVVGLIVCAVVSGCCVACANKCNRKRNKNIIDSNRVTPDMELGATYSAYNISPAEEENHETSKNSKELQDVLDPPPAYTP